LFQIGDCEQQQLTAHLIYDAMAESYSYAYTLSKSGVTLVLLIVYLAENSNLAVYIAYIIIIIQVNNLHLLH
jgi:hypothetical protein